MLKIKIDELKDQSIHFPVIRPIPIKKTKKKTKLFKKFSFFRRQFEVMEDHLSWSEYLNKFIFIPKGFVYDGASVPKFLHNFYGNAGVLFYGSLTHDFGYKYYGLLLIDEGYESVLSLEYELEFHRITKNELDKIFKDFCFQESGMKLGALIAFFALKLFGIFNWNYNRKNNLQLVHEYPHLFFQKRKINKNE